MSKEKKKRKASSFKPSVVPTLEEIRERAEAIKEKWTPEEKEKRMAPADRLRVWTAPVISGKYEVNTDIYGHDYT